MTREECGWAEGAPLPDDEDWDEDEERDEDEDENQKVSEETEAEANVEPAAEPGQLTAEHDTAFPPSLGHHSSSLLDENKDLGTPETDPIWQAELARFAALQTARFGSGSFNRDDPPGGPCIRSL